MTGRTVKGYALTCPVCGKRCFATRSEARTVARRLADGTRMNTYRCGNYWHLGHLPTAVIRGTSTRDDITTRRKP